MPTHVQQELGLVPYVHRLRRWLRALLERLGVPTGDEQSLDPLTLNYEVWRTVRRTVREWPNCREAPNSVRALVSTADWEEYWGVDTSRKEVAVAAFLRTRAEQKGLWIAGDPQVALLQDDSVARGEVRVSCRFVEASQVAPAPQAPPAPQPPPAPVGPSNQNAQANVRVPPTQRQRSAGSAQTMQLVDDGGFRLTLWPGDCIGAVRDGAVSPDEVNVRLDVQGFPYVDSKQCSVDVLDGRWAITNHASHGTCVVRRDGMRLMLREPEPYPLEEGDVVFLGPRRPLRVLLATPRSISAP